MNKLLVLFNLKLSFSNINNKTNQRNMFTRSGFKKKKHNKAKVTWLTQTEGTL